MGLMQFSLAGSLLTMVGAMAVLLGSISATPWTSQPADWPNSGIIPVTSTLTPSQMV